MDSKRSVTEQLFSVEGKTVLITGASSGIGRELAFFFSEAGANVVVASRRLDKLEAVVDEIAKKVSAGKAKAVQLDVSGSEQSIENTIDEAWSAFGRIDILINNAGVGVPEPPVIDAGVPLFETAFGVNTRGAWLVAKAVARLQVADKKGGAIVNTSSIADQTVLAFPIYSASKAAITMLTKHLAKELGKSGIRVNAVCPGIFPSEMAEVLVSNASVMKKVKNIPLSREGDTKRELHGAYLLLASDAGSYITGTTITVDGGLTLMSMDLSPE
eukprot:TRINITY_DN1972_c0_g1_i1.p1 TRINITY_DN1972_c0_g1~~TRINITY_DN1972_c0_g1_i1.p1  ORF type:complete len:291 (-),score=71.41 TRINITY_DN1972_c0_g1_i1:352-1167(-)